MGACARRCGRGVRVRSCAGYGPRAEPRLVRSSAHGVPVDWSASGDALRFLSPEGCLQRHADTMRVLPHCGKPDFFRRDAQEPHTGNPAMRDLPHHGNVCGRALHPRRHPARNLRNVPQRKPGTRQTCGPRRHDRVLRHLPSHFVVPAGILQPRQRGTRFLRQLPQRQRRPRQVLESRRHHRVLRHLPSHDRLDSGDLQPHQRRARNLRHLPQWHQCQG
jgi:hypothetical protein